jgi:hypothetical protein
MRYRINAPHVIAETMGGETVIVHLSTGCYFNLGGSGPEIWDAVAAGRDEDEIVRRLERDYDAPESELRDAVTRLVGELAGEDLIVPDPDAAATSTDAGEAAVGGARKAFAQPALGKFNDMQDIILLDPVHEVDARGWPYAEAEA